MSANRKPLPPLWVTVCSCVFCLFLVTPLAAIGHAFGWGSIAGLGIELDSATVSPAAWIFALDAVLFAGGLTGLAILWKLKWAYDFGIAYVAAAALLGASALTFNVEDFRENIESAWMQYAALAVFLVHLLANRKRWKTETANKTVDGSAKQPVMFRA